MNLWEREAELEALEDSFIASRAGHGRVVLIGGEAGIGKTRLLEAFADRHDADAEVMWGGCDDLSTPRPLGPFRDIAAGVGGDLRDTLGSGPTRSQVFEALLETLGRPGHPTIVVVEDVHWADAATLDVLKFLGRRIERLPALLAVTYRTEEVGPEHRLHLVIGDIPASAVCRLAPANLSKEAVAEMAEGFEGPTAELYAATGGNPFLVTEALAVPGSHVPASVRDAVASRVSRLEEQSRLLAEAASVIPGHAERWLLAELVADDPASLAECRARGLVEYDAWSVWYRHELVRNAVLNALTPDRRRELNVQALTALRNAGADVARIVHHAREAGDREAIVHYAPLAAIQASEASSHREALAHYRNAAEFVSLVPEAERARLLSDYAIEAYLMNEAAEALEAASRALALWRSLGDREREGVTLRWMSRFHWWLGHPQEAEQTGREAIAVLERIPTTTELPMAYSNLAQLSMLAQDVAPAERWATKAIEAARVVGDNAALAHALNNLGSTRARAGDLTGLALLEESLAVSLREGLEDHAGRAYVNLIWTMLDYREFSEAGRILDEGLAYAEKRELGGNSYYMRSERARLRFFTGDWPGTEADVVWVISRPEEPGITRMPALAIRAHLQVRQGDSAAATTLAEAREPADAAGELQRIAPVAVAEAELAWLNDDIAAIRSSIEPVYELALPTGQPWIVDELAFWMWRAQTNAPVPQGSETPYAMQMSGRWEEAAAAWAEVGCPYERAIALADAPDPKPLLEALEILHALGAAPAARLVRRRLQGMGVRGVPRGPRPETRADPAGLTPRQREVLVLLVAGLTNSEIAERLFVSPKTVDHHVSAILMKLEASSRQEAAKIAVEGGLLPDA
jgi:DNA-binding CsgD family transcriptional regulator/tetratricopeptide (TPR) repeat protein